MGETSWSIGAFAMEAAVQPETRYARLGGDRIAYQVLGEGPPDLVVTTGNFSHVDMVWEDPGITVFLRTLASFSRVIQFDRAAPAPPTRCRPARCHLGRRTSKT